MAKSKNSLNAIQIGPINYRLSFVDDRIQDSDQVLLGRVDLSRSKIEVTKDVSPDLMRVVLWHEIFHAIFSDRGLSFGEMEENIVDAMAYSIVQVLRQNPGLIALTVA